MKASNDIDAMVCKARAEATNQSVPCGLGGRNAVHDGDAFCYTLSQGELICLVEGAIMAEREGCARLVYSCCSGIPLHDDQMHQVDHLIRARGRKP